MLRSMLCLAVLLALGTHSTAQEKPRILGEGASPQMMLATATEKSGSVELRLILPEAVKVKKTREVERDGRKMVETYDSELTVVGKELIVPVDKDVQVYTAAGKKVATRDLPTLLKKETAVLWATSAVKVDPFFLQLIRAETLVIHIPFAKLFPPKTMPKPKKP